MQAIVVYESLWGNTAAIAQAIAEGLGNGTRALSTTEAFGSAVGDADLIVAGAPVLGFSLPTEQMRENLRVNPGKAPKAPDLSHPSMRSWLDALPEGSGRSAAFETRIWWSPRGSAPTISRGLERAGYFPISKAERFIVEGGYGPLRKGELERARQWGADLAKLMGS
ncbi:MAG: flavodoxin [Coriobacteriia bacterium]|nr:flavodoxin [Coriobacteriia bacterium]